MIFSELRCLLLPSPLTTRSVGLFAKGRRLLPCQYRESDSQWPEEGWGGTCGTPPFADVMFLIDSGGCKCRPPPPFGLLF